MIGTFNIIMLTSNSRLFRPGNTQKCYSEIFTFTVNHPHIRKGFSSDKGRSPF